MKLLKPVESIYHLLSATRNFLYDRSLLSTVKLPVPVVSVGNLSFGGVGKTPCIIFLADYFSADKKVTIITRSYKTDLQEPKLVNLKVDSAASVFGDEACLIQKSLPQCEVWTGPSKSKTAEASLASRPDVILVDDGFSHRRLERNFDLVLIDATQGFESYMREGISNLTRAHAVLITKTNIVTSKVVENIKQQILSVAPHLKNEIYKSSVKTELGLEKSTPLFVFCGLGQPESFYQGLKEQNFIVLHQESFADHHSYSDRDQNKIFAKFLDLKNQHRNLKLVTTKKDFVKLNNADLLKNVHVAEHEMMIERKEELLEKIRKSF